MWRKVSRDRLKTKHISQCKLVHIGTNGVNILEVKEVYKSRAMNAWVHVECPSNIVSGLVADKPYKCLKWQWIGLLEKAWWPNRFRQGAKKEAPGSSLSTARCTLAFRLLVGGVESRFIKQKPPTVLMNYQPSEAD